MYIYIYMYMYIETDRERERERERFVNLETTILFRLWGVPEEPNYLQLGHFPLK